jgi:hypothetical protein
MRTSDKEYKINILLNEIKHMEGLKMSFKKYKDYYEISTFLLRKCNDKNSYIQALKGAVKHHEESRD